MGYRNSTQRLALASALLGSPAALLVGAGPPAEARRAFEHKLRSYPSAACCNMPPILKKPACSTVGASAGLEIAALTARLCGRCPARACRVPSMVIAVRFASALRHPA